MAHSGICENHFQVSELNRLEQNYGKIMHFHRIYNALRRGEGQRGGEKDRYEVKKIGKVRNSERRKEGQRGGKKSRKEERRVERRKEGQRGGKKGREERKEWQRGGKKGRESAIPIVKMKQF